VVDKRTRNGVAMGQKEKHTAGGKECHKDVWKKKMLGVWFWGVSAMDPNKGGQEDGVGGGDFKDVHPAQPQPKRRSEKGKPTKNQVIGHKKTQRTKQAAPNWGVNSDQIMPL